MRPAIPLAPKTTTENPIAGSGELHGVQAIRRVAATSRGTVDWRTRLSQSALSGIRCSKASPSWLAEGGVGRRLGPADVPAQDQGSPACHRRSEFEGLHRDVGTSSTPALIVVAGPRFDRARGFSGRPAQHIGEAGQSAEARDGVDRPRQRFVVRRADNPCRPHPLPPGASEASSSRSLQRSPSAVWATMKVAGSVTAAERMLASPGLASTRITSSGLSGAPYRRSPSEKPAARTARRDRRSPRSLHRSPRRGTRRRRSPCRQ